MGCLKNHEATNQLNLITTNNMVKVTTNPKTGVIFTANPTLGKDGKQYGFIRLEENKIDLDGAIGSLKKTSILKQISAEAAAELVDGQEFPGQIVSTDFLAPQWVDHKPLQAPIAKGSSELRDVLCGGQKVYRKYEFTSNMKKASVKLTYDKVAATVEAIN